MNTGNTKHGHSNNGGRTREYNSWIAMRKRCLSPADKAYPHYGGRGIKICDRWIESFENFLADMGESPSPLHSLDRYPDNDGNYESGNVRWATPVQQSNNRRSNRIITVNGISKTITQWERHLGMPRSAINSRIYKGFTPEEAILIPYPRRRKKVKDVAGKQN